MTDFDPDDDYFGQESIDVRAPNGLRITGILQSGTGVSGIEFMYPKRDGQYDLTFDGTTNWETQEDFLLDLERVFIDEGGNEWRESQLVEQPREPEE